MKFKIGDRVIVEKSNIECTCECAGKTGTIVEGPLGRTFIWKVRMDNGGCYWCNVKCLAEDAKKQDKIVITHDGKTTTATLYREDGSKEVATAKCCPEDTFDFNFGAKLAMERLMKKVEPVTEWRVVDRKPRVGDYIRLKTNGGYSFSEPGDILKICKAGYLDDVYVYGKDHPRNTRNPDNDWCYTREEYEVVEKVTATEPKKPEPPKYFTGKVICVENRINDGEFTVGKIYEIKDGNFTDNLGKIRPNTHGRDRVKTLSDLENEYYSDWYYKFIPIVE